MTTLSAPPLENIADRMRPGLASSILLWTIGAFLLVFLAWAGLTRLDRVVRGEGKVIPSSELQTVSNLEGGIVEQIYVRQGQAVKAGDPLIRLDPTQMGADYGRERASFDALGARIARLESEAAGGEPRFGADLMAHAGDFVASEKPLHQSRMLDLGSQLGAGKARLTQAERAVAEARATVGARRAALDSARTQVEMIRPLVLRGIEPRMSLVEAENRVAVSSSELAAAEAAVARASAAVSEARAALAQQSNDWRARAAEELAAARGEMAAQQRALPALADRVDRTVVRAPRSGVVNRVLVSTVGGSIKPGDPLVEIVPSNETLLVQAAVRPSDIASIRIGQSATVKISAYEYAIFGGLGGKVVSISPDAVVEPRTGETHYLVRVRTDSEALRDPHNGRKLPIGPGMVAEVDILGAKRSVLSYILTPITRVRDDAMRE